MPGPVFIEGDGIDLRTVEAEDVEFLQAGIDHPDVRRYAGGDVVELLVCDGDDRLGNVSLAPIDERRGWANLGYWIHPDRQGAGHATEAARLIVGHGFDELGLHRVSATIVEHNEASKRVVEKLGFVHEGTSDDAFLDGEYVDRDVYAVLREEWTA